MKKRLFSILLSLCMVVTMIPMAGGAVFAAAATSVTIAGQTLNADTPYYHNGENGAAGKANNIAKDSSAVFDPASGTLTIDGLVVNGVSKSGIWANQDLIIKLVNNDENIIKVAGDNNAITVTSNSDLTITGPGTLITENGNNDATTIYASKAMTINSGAKVTATKERGRAQAINAPSITISGKNTEVTATNNGTSTSAGMGSYALKANTTTVSEGAGLTAIQGGNASVPAVYGTVNISEGSTVKAGTDAANASTLDSSTTELNNPKYQYLMISTAASGESQDKTVSTVNLTCDIAKLGLDTAKTEVNVSDLVPSAIGITTEGVYLDDDASLLMYKDELGRFVSVHEDIPVSVDREYGIKFFIELSSGYQWLDKNGSNTAITFTLNGGTATPIISYNNEYGAYAVIFSIGYPTDSTSPSAAVSDVNLVGKTGTPIDEQDVTISLTNDKFKAIQADTNVSSWFNLPAGLMAKVKDDVVAEADSAVITISGTPSEASDAVMDITIPGNVLSSDNALKVTTNDSAKYSITHAHDIIHVDAKEAKCTEPGNVEYYKCQLCGKLFSDAAGEKEIKLEETVVTANHEFGTEYISMGTDGHAKKCINCDTYSAVESHEFNGNTCALCGYTKSSGGHYKPTQKPEIIAGEGSKADLTLNGTKATITVEDGYEITDVILNGTSLGKVTEVTGLKTGDKVEIKTAAVFNIGNYVKDLKLIARSSKTANKNVRVKVASVTDQNGNPVDLSVLKDKGYTVKYKFYRSEKKASEYGERIEKDIDNNSYLNNIGSKGTKYFYKVKVMVYDANGNLAAQTGLNQCKYATRTWSK